ncbi:hypothetical protein U0070_020514, partial [Myodes glareolus]
EPRLALKTFQREGHGDGRLLSRSPRGPRLPRGTFRSGGGLSLSLSDAPPPGSRSRSALPPGGDLPGRPPARQSASRRLAGPKAPKNGEEERGTRGVEEGTRRLGSDFSPMVQSDTSKSPPIAAVAQESQMELLESAAPAGALGAQGFDLSPSRRLLFRLQTSLASLAWVPFATSSPIPGLTGTLPLRAFPASGKGRGRPAAPPRLLPGHAARRSAPLPGRSTWRAMDQASGLDRLKISYGKGARRKNRFKGSDGSTSSDTTSNSFVRQVGELESALIEYSEYKV